MLALTPKDDSASALAEAHVAAFGKKLDGLERDSRCMEIFAF